MTTYLGKSCSFCLPRVPFVNCRQFMYLVVSLLVLRAGYGIWLCRFLIIACLFAFQADVLDVVRGVGITFGPDHAVVVVEGKFILQAVPEHALIKRHVSLEQIEIQWNVESIAISIGNGIACCNRCILISSTYSDSCCVSVVNSSMTWYRAFSLSCAVFQRSL